MELCNRLHHQTKKPYGNFCRPVIASRGTTFNEDSARGYNRMMIVPTSRLAEYRELICHLELVLNRNCSGNSLVVLKAGYNQVPIVSSQPATLISSEFLTPCLAAPYKLRAVGSLPARIAITGSLRGQERLGAQIPTFGLIFVGTALAWHETALVHRAPIPLEAARKPRQAGIADKPDMAAA